MTRLVGAGMPYLFAVILSGLFSASMLAANASPMPDALRAAAPTDRDAMLKAACGPAGVKQGKACASCPSYLETPGKELFELTGLITGSFSAAGVNEAALRFNGCEPHAGNFGGMVLLRNAGKGWKFIRYVSGTNPAACQKASSGGRDLLVCVSYYAQSGENDEFVSLIDWSRKEPDEKLLGTQDTVVASCTMGSRDYTTGSIDKVSVSGDGIGVDLTAGKGKLPSTVKRDACENYKAPAGRKFHLEYQLTNGHAVIAPSSAAAEKRLKSLFGE